MLRSILPPASYILYSINADRDGSGSTNCTESALTLAEGLNLTNDQRGQAWGMFHSDTKEERNPFIGALSSVGVDAETAINISEAYRDLSNRNAYTDLKPKERKATFWSYVNTLGLNSGQRDTVSNVFKFYGSYLC